MFPDFGELLEYDEDCPFCINVYIPSHVVKQEIKVFKQDPFHCLYLGNHRVFETKTPRTQEVKDLQYIGLFWLMINRMQNSLECNMHIDTISRFICYKLGLTLATLENASKKETDEVLLFDKSAYKDVEIFYDTQSQSNENISFKKLKVHTELFGVLRAPTKSEMNDFLSWAKITTAPLY